MEYIIRELEKFYYLYEELIIKDRAYYLAIIIDDNKIIMNIVKNGEIDEEVELIFQDKERKLYRYLVIRLFLTILGNVVIHNDKNIFYNDKQRENIKFIVGDIEIYKILLEIKEIQKDMIINKDSKLIRDMYRDIPIRYRIRNKKYEEELERRYQLSRKILKVGK